MSELLLHSDKSAPFRLEVRTADQAEVSRAHSETVGHGTVKVLEESHERRQRQTQKRQSTPSKCMIFYLIYCEVPSVAGGRTMNIKALLFTYSKQVFLWMLAPPPRHEQEHLQMIGNGVYK